MYAPPLAAAWSHLPGRKGMASGIIISGFGFGGFIFGNVSHYLCNPDNLLATPYTDSFGHSMRLFPDSVAARVPHMLRSLGLMWLCLFAFGLLAISKYDGKPYDEHRPEADELASKEPTHEEIAETEIPGLEIVKTGKFVLLFVLAMCHLYYGYYMSNIFKQYGFVGGIDDKTLSRIGSFGSLFNGSFKIFWATMLDYFPFKRCYLAIFAIQFSMLVWVHWAN
jgi:hypothetical protein